MVRDRTPPFVCLIDCRQIDIGSSEIVPGKKLGRTIGIPTCKSVLNQATSNSKSLFSKKTNSFLESTLQLQGSKLL